MRLPLLLLCALALCTGCHFHRAQVNPHVRELKTDWIQPGVTTRNQVIARLGCPPATPLGGIRGNSLRWSLVDRQTRTLEIGYILTPTFRLGETHLAEDILIEFDDDNCVSRVSRTLNDGANVKLIEWREKAP